MKRTNLTIGLLLAAILLATQVIAVGAAPAMQETTPVTGKVKSITVNTDADPVTVTVELTDESGATQTLDLSLDEAAALGLVFDDEMGNPVADDTKIGNDVEIPPAAPEEKGATEEQHPVGSAISNFFSDTLGVDYETVMAYHDNGMGFGTIAQALWMTNALDGGTETFEAILYAKENKDFSGIALEDGSTPTNWGQFRKAVMSDRKKSKENLGAIMSGRAETEGENETQDDLKDHGKPDKDKDKGKPDKEDKSNNGKGNNK